TQIHTLSLHDALPISGSETKRMKHLGTFLKTTMLGGLFVLLPVVVLVYLLRQVFQIAVGVATPIASTLSKAGIHEPQLPVLFARSEEHTSELQSRGHL